MTEANDGDDLAARARQAFERAVQEGLADEVAGEPTPSDPATIAKLEQAVRSLRRLDREVFLAVRLDGMSYVEIGVRTGLSDRQVRARMARALFELDAFMRDQPVRRWWPF